MGGSDALADPIFRTYLLFATVTLGGAGVVFAWLRGRGYRVGGAWQTYVGWLIIVPIILAALWLGRLATIGLFTLLAILGAKEFARATGLYRDWLMIGVVYAAILAVGASCAVADPNTGESGWYGLFVALPAFTIPAIFLVPVLRNDTRRQLQQMALAVVTFIYIGWLFGHIAFLSNTSNAYGYILFLVFAVALNDVCAFIGGKLCGRRPLRSQISPSKTFEGALCALGFSLLFPWLMWFSLPTFTATELLLTGLIVGVGGQLGDLSISVIKRDIGIKDTGSVLPGHGGILDRIDSLIYSAPLFFHMVVYYQGLH